MELRTPLCVLCIVISAACGGADDESADDSSESPGSGGMSPDPAGTGGSSTGGSSSGSGGTGEGGTGDAGFPEPLRIATDGGLTCALDGTTARCWGHDFNGTTVAVSPLEDVIALGGQLAVSARTRAGVAYLLGGIAPSTAWDPLLSEGSVRHINYSYVFSDAGTAYRMSHSEIATEFSEPLWDGVSSGPISCGIRRTDQNLTCGDFFPSTACGFAPEVYAPPPGTFSAIAAGYFHLCALATDGTVSCWGAGTALPTEAQGEFCFAEDLNLQQAQNVAPPGTFRQVSTGTLHSCGVRTDGTVTCWGAGTTDDDCASAATACGQAMPPPDSDFVQVTAGLAHSCGLKESGKVVCWGSSTGGKGPPPPELQP